MEGSAMNRAFLQDLFALTLRDPRAAAQSLLRLDLNVMDTIRAAGLVTVVNTIIFSLSLGLFGSTGAPLLFSSPFLYATAMFGGLLAYGWLLAFAGRSLGGEGQFAGMLILLVWLQALRVLAQAVIVILAMILPFMAFPVSLGIGLFGIWLTLHFVSAGHGFDGLGRSFLAALLAGMGLLVLLVMALTLLGIAPPQPI